MVAQSWLMKLIAIELRLTALNRQRSHTQRLMRALLDDGSEGHTGKVRVTQVKGHRCGQKNFMIKFLYLVKEILISLHVYGQLYEICCCYGLEYCKLICLT